MKRDTKSAGAQSGKDGRAGDRAGPFRIHVVSQLTSVPEPTLRAWERRYGIPTPERTATNYRLYGAHEVEQVRKMKALCVGGLSARDAAERVRAEEPAHSRAHKDGVAVEDPYRAAREGLLAAITVFDVDALEHALRQLMFLADGTTILDRVLAPLLVEIGERWHAGKLTVAEEHLASQRISAFVRDLLQLSPGAASKRKVVLASFADDDHEIGLLGLALRLSAWELRPVFLGARTPPAAVQTAVESTDAALVALSTTMPLDRPRARELVRGYAAACVGVPWFVGGSGVAAIADLVRDAGGHVDPHDPVALRALVESALRKQPSRKGGRE